MSLPLSRPRRPQRKTGPKVAVKLSSSTPTAKFRVRMIKLERVKDYILMEEKFGTNQKNYKPREKRNEDHPVEMEDDRGTPVGVCTLKEILDDGHAIVSSAVSAEYYAHITYL